MKTIELPAEYLQDEEKRLARVAEINDLLSGCRMGTENYYRHWLSKRVVYTDGVKLLAEECGAYWLIDAIMSHHTCIWRKAVLKDPRVDDFAIWQLRVVDRYRLDKHRANMAVLECLVDTGCRPIIQQWIPYTDFPMDEIKLYVERGDGLKVLMLPVER